MPFAWLGKEKLLTHHTDKAVMTMMNMQNIIDCDYTSVEPSMEMGKLVHAISQAATIIFQFLTMEEYY